MNRRRFLATLGSVGALFAWIPLPEWRSAAPPSCTIPEYLKAGAF